MLVNRTGLALAALALSAFAIGTTEFVIAGLLPDLASDLRVSIPTAGLLVSGYALGVVVGAPLVTIAVARLPRKWALLGLLVLFIAGNVTSAIAHGFAMLLLGRVLAALCHGAFLGVGSLAAAEMAGEQRRARAIAAMVTGLTLSTVVGVPMGTFLGQHWGWRVTFWAVAALGIAGMAGIAALVPPLPALATHNDLTVFRRPQLWLALAMTALGFGAVYAPYTFIAPIMTSLAGYAPGDLSWLLIVFGVGLVLGNWLGARAADWRLMGTIIALLTGLVALLLILAALPSVITLFALGVVAFATVPAFTSRVIATGGGTTLASSAAVAAFNLGNATGAYLAGLAVTDGYAATGWVGAAMALGGLGVAVLSAALPNRKGDRDHHPAALAR
ncbi:MFS transporter [Kutzneria buriramensis]|uniref:DHA1 family inner membrane transport protein n=1 Tax=Kutzneria buriramensis TaxID=1045776 RepID=A0A3E0I4V1_9PSEU|nr:MFS transporter [Kutzneria buriramensis]REH53788.1 DHA1 family inner membrane transport protein [Kutzneria buriramensis]